MSVHQTRAHFFSKYQFIVDNESVGRDLAEVYWRPGNSELFLSLVQKLTGKPLTGEAWVDMLDEDEEELVMKEKLAYEEALALGPKYPEGVDVDLQMRIKLVHGDEVGRRYFNHPCSMMPYKIYIYIYIYIYIDRNK